MLRLATVEDIDLVYSMAENFIKTTRHKDTYTEEAIKKVIEHLITSPTGVIVLFEDKGFIAGMISPFFFGDILQATEVAWWVEPEHRKDGVGDQLLSAFEYWAKEKMGCKIVSMAALDDKLEKFYVSKGYLLCEHIYLKEL